MTIDPNSEIESRKTNTIEEAQRLTENVLDKLEKDVSDAGYDLKDIQLLILYQSYRGQTQKEDRLICEEILNTITERFKGRTAPNRLRLIGHTTAGEIENEDLVLKDITGIGYNGLSLLALVTNLPIGIGRTWGLKSETESAEQGREMVHDAWVDFNQKVDRKEHSQSSKTLCVLAGVGASMPWQNHFLAEGIAGFMGCTREARIANVMGGLSADGIIGRTIYQFYGKIGRKSELGILEGEAVCALIPNLSEPSIGVDTAPIQRIGRSHVFHFDPKGKPQFTYVKSIGNKDPREVYAKTIYKNEAQISRKIGLPVLDEKMLFGIISEFDPLAFHPVCGKYALAFPFGNYAPAIPMKTIGKNLILQRPVRCYEPKMSGYIVQVDCEKIQKGACNVYNMLRENRGFAENDVTLLFPCILRRMSEILAGCTAKNEPKILKEALSSTQVMGFLGYGEISFTHLLQEPYVWSYSCWGITLRSVGATRKAHGRILPERKATGSSDLDGLLLGGIPKNYAVVLTGSPSDERAHLLRNFLEAGTNNDEIVFYVTTEADNLGNLLENPNFHLFLCNPKPKTKVPDLPNVTKLRSMTDLTNLNISLVKAYRNVDASKKKRILLETVSNVLLNYEAKATCKWVLELTADLSSKGFTMLAVLDPSMHPPDQANAVVNSFDGEVSISQTEDATECSQSLRVKRLKNQDYLKNSACLKI